MNSKDNFDDLWTFRGHFLNYFFIFSYAFFNQANAICENTFGGLYNKHLSAFSMDCKMTQIFQLNHFFRCISQSSTRWVVRKGRTPFKIQKSSNFLVFIKSNNCLNGKGGLITIISDYLQILTQ